MLFLLVLLMLVISVAVVGDALNNAVVNGPVCIIMMILDCSERPFNGV